MRYIHFFGGGPRWGVWVGNQKVYVEKLYVLLQCLMKSGEISSPAPDYGAPKSFHRPPSHPQERQRHVNLREIPGTPAGCPWDTWRDKQGSSGRYSRKFLLCTAEKLAETGLFCRDIGLGTPAPQEGCQKLYDPPPLAPKE